MKGPLMQTQEIMTSYFFPNPFGDGQSYSIDAASLEDAQAQLNQPTVETVSEPIEEQPEAEPSDEPSSEESTTEPEHPETPEPPAPADLSEEELPS